MAQAAKEKENYSAACRAFTRTRGDLDQPWLRELRERAGQTFNRLDFPTTRDEDWKYTNLGPLLRTQFRQMLDLDLGGMSVREVERLSFPEAERSRLVFVNGIYAPELSDTSGLGREVVTGNPGEVVAESGEAWGGRLGGLAGFEHDAFTALNTALIGDGAVVRIPAGRVAAAPIHLLFLITTHEKIVCYPRILIVAEEGASATLVESYVSTQSSISFNNAVTEVFVGAGASVEHYRLQLESELAFHIGTTKVSQERGSSYRSVAISLGAELSRHTLDIAQRAEGTETTIDGLYVATGGQHVDNHTSIDHAFPHGQSNQLYKGILDGRARAVFNGKVFVREGALLTDARQLNRNLLLSTETTVDTKPQLEILADDVKCSHGATVGQLEDEEIFYLTSRGIRPERARALLTFGFAEDLIGRIKIGSVREQLDRIVLEKLHQSLEVN
ncbi:MAG: Fe-S cluster assembly protein SufD [Acidobacteria bacterium]|nr:Fe-S cluster assembly protein SufD [Acidobacteriota bacterium]